MNENFVAGCFIIVSAIIATVIVLAIFVGLPISTGSGNQVGYVSAIEKTGIIWKTGRAYIKPTLESTQEDVYCVIGDELLDNLTKASINKSRVKINHYSLLASGISKCNGEEAIIKSFDVIN